MKNYLILFSIVLLLAGCSKDESSKSSLSINAEMLKMEEGVKTGEYVILTDLEPKTIYYRCIYFPFPNAENSFACDASLTGRYSDPILRLKDGTENIVYIPSGTGKYAGAEFDITTGKGLNKEAASLEIRVYKVQYDKKNKIYRLTSEK